ncbi:hypothetical protein pEaSNUABM19_00575 [Erwinia phage pEa_SNUABM_19]|uniref:Uncharacterized protein n=1 Tax=Erwinia phage pEa_SNUABM_12 TaxID=2768773 RepID=A0A7L8ZMD8_9CAUD|nr:hypothetical protein pEaSNUABM12_00493 [Erwinia phage pEa_SNUABM_12]QXO11686.1 hypothetical protein pEaSNUABM19_00575 [Erwinia phage pEa_SNUABM_19]
MEQHKIVGHSTDESTQTTFYIINSTNTDKVLFDSMGGLQFEPITYKNEWANVMNFTTAKAAYSYIKHLHSKDSIITKHYNLAVMGRTIIETVNSVVYSTYLTHKEHTDAQNYGHMDTFEHFYSSIHPEWSESKMREERSTEAPEYISSVLQNAFELYKQLL